MTLTILLFGSYNFWFVILQLCFCVKYIFVFVAVFYSFYSMVDLNHYQRAADQPHAHI